jgi:hypothetical protein
MKTIFIFLFLISSAVHAQDAGTMSEKLGQLKSAVEANLEIKPYGQEQQQNFRAYFIELETINETLSFPKNKRRFNGSLRNYGVEKFCDVAVLTNDLWKKLLKNCTKNAFFLCSDKLQDYPQIRKNFADNLEDDTKKIFLESASCNQ